MVEKRLLLRLAVLPAVFLCACHEPTAPMPPRQPPSVAHPVSDPLGLKPALLPPKAFDPPAPVAFTTKAGTSVWLLERHDLPLVSLCLSVPYGSGSDPKGKAGLAHITADMLDEGAGSRSAVELSSAVNDLGATLTTSASRDGTAVTLTVLKKNVEAAFAIFADVVTRPRFDPTEWKRVHNLWQNDLKERAQEPSAVAGLVANAVLFGLDSPYGHPIDGLVATSAAIDLPAVKASYASHVRPDKATLAASGDLTAAELAKLVETHLGHWAAPREPAPPLPSAAPYPVRPRYVLVDRPGAPQSVIGVIREGIAASDSKAPDLDLVNTILGGSFTSRLNQDLREDHGWTYGARSAFGETRAQGAFVAVASVVADATGKALVAMLDDIGKVSSSGVTEDELETAKAQDRADLVQQYDSVEHIARRLGALATLGLPPGFDGDASRIRQKATKAELDGLGPFLSPKQATVFIVGPRAVVEPQLAALGLPKPERWDEEGRSLDGR